MYPVAAAITTGILLVGRPRPAIFLFLFVALRRASVVSPLGNKSLKDFIPGTASHSDYDEHWILWESRSSPHGAADSPTKKIEENRVESFFLKKFSSSEKNLQFRKSDTRGRVVARTKLVDRLHNNNNNKNKGQKRFWKVDDPSETTKASATQSKIGSSACGNTP